MTDLSEFVIRTGKTPKAHPFAHIALTRIPEADSARAVVRRPSAHMALVMSKKAPIVARTGQYYTSSDLRLLAVHGLTRHVGRRADGSALVEISHKGRKVLRMLAEGIGG